MQKYTNILLIVCLGLFVNHFWTSSASGQKLTWHPFDKALAISDTSNRPILVNIQAPWCGWCRKMKQEVYPTLASLLSDHFILTHLNRDDNHTTYRYNGSKLTPVRLSQKFRVQSVPAVVLLDRKGKYLTHLLGFVPSETLAPFLQYIASNAYRHQSFEQFKAEY